MKKNTKLMAVAMAGLLLAGCASGSSQTDSTTRTDGVSADTGVSSESSIHLVNGKIEIASQLEAYAKAYEEKTGVKVTVESLGGGVDIASTIKGYLAAGNMPDLFVFGGEGEYETWKDYLADLSDEPWAADTDLAFKNADGAVMGFPYAVEGYGITYNKDLLDQAGIDPTTLTNIDAYADAFAKLDSMKEELGIVAVTSMAAESGQMYWSMGNHNFGAYLAQGLEREDTTYIDMLKEGKIDNERMTQYGEFVKLLFDYADQTVLLSGTYDDQLALWAQGKTVFVHQGNWIDPSLPDYNVEFSVGMSPLAFKTVDTDGILADAPSFWGLYKDSDNIEAAKAFLTDLAMSEEGQQCLVLECGMVSPYKSTTIEPTTPLAKNLMEWTKAGKTYAWQWLKVPEGFAMNVTGPIFETFARGDVDVAGFVTLMENAMANLEIIQ